MLNLLIVHISTTKLKTFATTGSQYLCSIALPEDYLSCFVRLMCGTVSRTWPFVVFLAYSSAILEWSPNLHGTLVGPWYSKL